MANVNRAPKPIQDPSAEQRRHPGHENRYPKGTGQSRFAPAGIGIDRIEKDTEGVIPAAVDRDRDEPEHGDTPVRDFDLVWVFIGKA